MGEEVDSACMIFTLPSPAAATTEQMERPVRRVAAISRNCLLGVAPIA